VLLLINKFIKNKRKKQGGMNMRLMSFSESVEKEEKLKEWARSILSSAKSSETKDREISLQKKENVFVDDIVYSKGKIYAKSEKALPKNMNIKSYYICGLKLSDAVYDGKNTSILFIDLSEKPIFNTMTNLFTYPLIGKESYDSFMKEMGAKSIEGLVNRQVTVYSSDKCTKGISVNK
jgi:hypothetical protein